jgi:hypothetical protein
VTTSSSCSAPKPSGAFEPARFRFPNQRRLRHEARRTGADWDIVAECIEVDFARANETRPAERERAGWCHRGSAWCATAPTEGRTMSQTPRRQQVERFRQQCRGAAILARRWRRNESDTPSFRGCSEGSDRAGQTAADNGDIIWLIAGLHVKSPLLSIIADCARRPITSFTCTGKPTPWDDLAHAHATRKKRPTRRSVRSSRPSPAGRLPNSRGVQSGQFLLHGHCHRGDRVVVPASRWQARSLKFSGIVRRPLGPRDDPDRRVSAHSMRDRLPPRLPIFVCPLDSGALLVLGSGAIGACLPPLFLDVDGNGGGHDAAHGGADDPHLCRDRRHSSRARRTRGASAGSGFRGISAVWALAAIAFAAVQLDGWRA